MSWDSWGNDSSWSTGAPAPSPRPPLRPAAKAAGARRRLVVSSQSGSERPEVSGLLGTYDDSGEHHGKRSYRRDDGNVFLYFWIDGARSGWWFGESVGGNQGWAFCQAPGQDGLPPKAGWKVPWNAPRIEPGVLLVHPEDSVPASISAAAVAASKAPAPSPAKGGGKGGGKGDPWGAGNGDWDEWYGGWQPSGKGDWKGGGVKRLADQWAAPAAKRPAQQQWAEPSPVVLFSGAVTTGGSTGSAASRDWQDERNMANRLAQGQEAKDAEEEEASIAVRKAILTVHDVTDPSSFLDAAFQLDMEYSKQLPYLYTKSHMLAREIGLLFKEVGERVGTLYAWEQPKSPHGVPQAWLTKQSPEEQEMMARNAEAEAKALRKAMMEAEVSKKREGENLKRAEMRASMAMRKAIMRMKTATWKNYMEMYQELRKVFVDNEMAMGSQAEVTSIEADKVLLEVGTKLNRHFPWPPINNDDSQDAAPRSLKEDVPVSVAGAASDLGAPPALASKEEHAAALGIRKALLALKTATEENWAEAVEEYERAYLNHAENLGSLAGHLEDLIAGVKADLNSRLGFDAIV